MSKCFVCQSEHHKDSLLWARICPSCVIDVNGSKKHWNAVCIKLNEINDELQEKLQKIRDILNEDILARTALSKIDEVMK